MELISNNRNDDLPCFLSASLFNTIVSNMITKDWSPLCFELLEDFKFIIEELIEKIF